MDELQAIEFLLERLKNTRTSRDFFEMMKR